jgi:ABC-2 type transport system ATP-binding protein
MQKKFFELINEYVDKGATCLLSTHVLSEVDKYCKNAAIMRDGRLTMLDTPHIDDETFLNFYEDDEEA